MIKIVKAEHLGQHPTRFTFSDGKPITDQHAA